MSEIRETVATIERQKAELEDKIAAQVRLFEAETGLFVAEISLDRYARGLRSRSRLFRVEAIIQFWRKISMRDLEADRQIQQLRNKARAKKEATENE